MTLHTKARSGSGVAHFRLFHNILYSGDGDVCRQLVQLEDTTDDQGSTGTYTYFYERVHYFFFFLNFSKR